MATTGGLIRVIAWPMAICFALASALYLALQFDLVAPPPNFPESGTLVDNLLIQGDYLRQTWPVDMASSLLYALGFALLVLLAGPLARLARPGDGRASSMTGAFVAAGTVGIVAQLIYVGAHDVIANIAYCDCGFKEPEVIAQGWARFLIDGATGWLINGTGILLLFGFVAAGAAIGGVGMPSGWRMLSWLTAVLLALNVVVGVVGVEGPIGPVLLGIETGVLAPIWAIWLGLRAKDATLGADAGEATPAT